MDRKEIAIMFNVPVQKIQRVEQILKIKGKIIKGKRVFNEESTKMIIDFLKENHSLPSDALLIKNTESDYITPRGEVYKKKGEIYFKAKLDINWQGYSICAIAHQVKTKCKPRKHKVYFRYSEE